MANLPPPVPRTFNVSEVESAAFLNSIRDALNFMLNKPYAFLFQNTGQSTANGINVAAALDGTVWDNYGGHNNTTNNTRYTAQVAGTYGVLMHASWPPNATGARQIEPYVNGSNITSGSQLQATPTTNWTAHETYTQLFLNVGDYVEMWVDQHSGGALTLNSGNAPYQTYMQIEWLRK